MPNQILITEKFFGIIGNIFDGGKVNFRVAKLFLSNKN